MSWDDTDKNTFLNAVNGNVGQINMETKDGSVICTIAKSPKFKTYLEVGTWNGLGSTRCFVEGFKQRLEPYVFYSLECNREKSEFARRLYASHSDVHILTDTLVREEELVDVGKIFPNYVEKWHQTDIENIKMCNYFFDRPDIPETFDVVLLDGGEYTTYFEFLKIKDKCKILMMDDICVDKCKKIIEILNNDSTWRLIYQNNERNGFSIYEKI